MLAASVTAVVAIPWTPDDAMHHASQDRDDPGDKFTWSFLREDGTRTVHTLVLDIPEDSFRGPMDRNPYATERCMRRIWSPSTTPMTLSSVLSPTT